MTSILSILSLILLTSFQKKGVEITFANDSGETFLKMTVKTGGNEFSFYNICPGEKQLPL